MAIENLKLYNGWHGKVRNSRGSAFYALLKQGKIPAPKKCAACGQENGPVWNTYHAEEYGSTWECYVEAAKPLCPRCHGMIHARFKLPNRWKRYKQRILQENFGGLGTFKNMGEVYAYMRTIKDIAYVEDQPTGIAWLDAISLTAYSGPEKIATFLDPDLGEIPDPKIYGTNWETMSGVILRANGDIYEVEWHNEPSQPSLF